MPAFRIGALLLVLLTSNAALGTEEDFIQVDRMPKVEGTLQRSISRQDEATGLTYTQRIYEQDFPQGILFTYVTEAVCEDKGTGSVPPKPYIIAYRYVIKKPQAFSAVTLHDIFKEVYVEDREGRIRLYENMSGPAMIELSDNYRPSCSGI